MAEFVGRGSFFAILGREHAKPIDISIPASIEAKNAKTAFYQLNGHLGRGALGTPSENRVDSKTGEARSNSES